MDSSTLTLKSHFVITPFPHSHKSYGMMASQEKFKDKLKLPDTQVRIFLEHSTKTRVYFNIYLIPKEGDSMMMACKVKVPGYNQHKKEELQIFHGYTAVNHYYKLVGEQKHVTKFIDFLSDSLEQLDLLRPEDIFIADTQRFRSSLRG